MTERKKEFLDFYEKSKSTDDLYNYIIDRERRLLDRIEKPLEDYKHSWIGSSFDSVWMDTNCNECKKKHRAIDEALSIIREERG